MVLWQERLQKHVRALGSTSNRSLVHISRTLPRSWDMVLWDMVQMFPAMSKRHSELLQMYSNNEANADRIWKVAQQVWKSCSSSMVSRAFIHAYRIMDKIIENDGHNHWLVDGTPHCNIRRDFIDTKHGIAPRPIIDIDM
jgi:hypothetical protein